MTAPDPHGLDVLNDPARLAALRGTGLLDSPPEERFDRLTREAARRLVAPLALVNLVDDQRQFSKSCFAPGNWPAGRNASLPDSFCKYAVRSREPLVISDTHGHPLVSSSAMVTELGIRSYLGIPLVTPDGHALGSLCIADFIPRTWPEEDVRALQALADEVMMEISRAKEGGGG